MPFIECCDNGRGSSLHRTAEACMDCGPCMAPDDHHPYSRILDLERGKWSYLVLSHSDELLDATSSITDAVRAVRRYHARTPGPKDWVEARKGLTYGIIIERSDGLVATIVPTPRHR